MRALTRAHIRLCNGVLVDLSLNGLGGHHLKRATSHLRLLNGTVSLQRIYHLRETITRRNSATTLAGRRT